jgi:hypothetical protein
MTSTRNMIASAALAVAFLSAGAFAQAPATPSSSKTVNVTVINKTVAQVAFSSFAS